MKPFSLVVIETVAGVGAVSATAGGMVLSDVATTEGAVTGGIVGGIVVTVGALVNLYLRVRKESDASRTARLEADQTIADQQSARDRKSRRDALEEWQKTVADLRTDRELDRKEIHELRNAFHTAKMEYAVVQERLAACEADRADMTRRIEALEHGKPQ